MASKPSFQGHRLDLTTPIEEIVRRLILRDGSMSVTDAGTI